MKIGDTAECAIWLDGTETDDMLRQWKADCPYLISRSYDPPLKLGPISFEIKHPGEDRVPQVPDHLQGPDVRLLIGTAEVLGHDITQRASFLSELREADLVQLRRETKRAYGHALPDNVCDQIIERMGPVAASRTLH